MSLNHPKVLGYAPKIDRVSRLPTDPRDRRSPV